MSATRGINDPKRRPHDFYRTPEWATRAILPVLEEHIRPRAILEPGAGSGAIAWVIHLRWPKAEYVAIELNIEHQWSLRNLGVGLTIGDYLEQDDKLLVPPYDLVIMNPPYSGPKRQDLVMEFTKRALVHAGKKGVVAVLTRLNWLGSQKRAQWHRDHRPFVGILPKRPSFTGDGKTDAVEYCWLVYGIPDLRGQWRILELPK